jgi:hypothetical protein
MIEIIQKKEENNNNSQTNNVVHDRLDEFPNWV